MLSWCAHARRVKWMNAASVFLYKRFQKRSWIAARTNCPQAVAAWFGKKKAFFTNEFCRDPIDRKFRPQSEITQTNVSVLKCLEMPQFHVLHEPILGRAAGIIEPERLHSNFTRTIYSKPSFRTRQDLCQTIRGGFERGRTASPSPAHSRSFNTPRRISMIWSRWIVSAISGGERAMVSAVMRMTRPRSKASIMAS